MDERRGKNNHIYSPLPPSWWGSSQSSGMKQIPITMRKLTDITIRVTLPMIGGRRSYASQMMPITEEMKPRSVKTTHIKWKRPRSWVGTRWIWLGSRYVSFHVRYVPVKARVARRILRWRLGGGTFKFSPCSVTIFSISIGEITNGWLWLLLPRLWWDPRFLAMLCRSVRAHLIL